MEFFDKKEEVMDIAMTRRGRELYAVGEFNPTYYAFADDEIIYESECVTGSNQTIILAASASFEGLAALNADNGTELILVNADTTSITFTTNSSKAETASDADEIGTNLSAATTAIATKSLHVAFTAAIAAGTLKMDLYPETWTNETKIWLSQLGAGGPGLSAGGLTTITVPANISANAAGSGVNGPFTRTTRIKSGGVQKEVQNRSAKRIKDNMRVKLQTGTQSAMGIKNYVTSSLFEPHFRILGKSSRLDQEAPAWHVKTVNDRGVMSSSAGPDGTPAVSFVPTELSGAAQGSGLKKKGIYKDASKTNEEMLLRYNKEIIPQINVFCDYNVKLVDVQKNLITDAETETYKKLEKKAATDKTLESEITLYNFKNMLKQRYGGDVLMLLRKTTDDIVLDFVENNVDETDFTLEAYEYQYDAKDNITGLKQLNFSDDDHTPDFVEYFFDISTDADADVDLNVKYVLEPPMQLEEEEEFCGTPPLPTIVDLTAPDPATVAAEDLAKDVANAMAKAKEDAEAAEAAGVASAVAGADVTEKLKGKSLGIKIDGELCKYNYECFSPKGCQAGKCGPTAAQKKQEAILKASTDTGAKALELKKCVVVGEVKGLRRLLYPGGKAIHTNVWTSPDHPAAPHFVRQGHIEGAGKPLVVTWYGPGAVSDPKTNKLELNAVASNKADVVGITHIYNNPGAGALRHYPAPGTLGLYMWLKCVPPSQDSVTGAPALDKDVPKWTKTPK